MTTPYNDILKEVAIQEIEKDDKLKLINKLIEQKRDYTSCENAQDACKKLANDCNVDLEKVHESVSGNILVKQAEARKREAEAQSIEDKNKREREAGERKEEKELLEILSMRMKEMYKVENDEKANSFISLLKDIISIFPDAKDQLGTDTKINQFIGEENLQGDLLQDQKESNIREFIDFLKRQSQKPLSTLDDESYNSLDTGKKRNLLTESELNKISEASKILKEKLQEKLKDKRAQEIKQKIERGQKTSEVFKTSKRDLENIKTKATTYGLDLGNFYLDAGFCKAFSDNNTSIEFDDFFTKIGEISTPDNNWSVANLTSEEIEIRNKEELADEDTKEKLKKTLSTKEAEALKKLIQDKIKEVEVKIEKFEKAVEKFRQICEKEINAKYEGGDNLIGAKSLYEFFLAIASDTKFIETPMTPEEKKKFLDELKRIADKYKSYFSGSPQVNIYDKFSELAETEKTKTEIDNDAVKALNSADGAAIRILSECKDKERHLADSEKAKVEKVKKSLEGLRKKVQEAHKDIKGAKERKENEEPRFLEISKEYVESLTKELKEGADNLKDLLEIPSAREQENIDTAIDSREDVASTIESYNKDKEKCSKMYSTGSERYKSAFERLIDKQIEGKPLDIRINTLIDQVEETHSKKLDKKASFSEKIRNLEKFLTEVEDSYFLGQLEKIKKESPYYLAEKLESARATLEGERASLVIKINQGETSETDIERIKEISAKLKIDELEILRELKSKFAINISRKDLSKEKEKVDGEINSDEIEVDKFLDNRDKQNGYRKKLEDEKIKLLKKRSKAKTNSEIENINSLIAEIDFALNKMDSDEDILKSKKRLHDALDEKITIGNFGDKNKENESEEDKKKIGLRIKERYHKRLMAKLEKSWWKRACLNCPLISPLYHFRLNRVAKWHDRMAIYSETMLFKNLDNPGAFNKFFASRARKKFEKAKAKFDAWKTTMEKYQEMGVKGEELMAERYGGSENARRVIEGILKESGHEDKDCADIEGLRKVLDEAKENETKLSKEFYEKEILERFKSLGLNTSQIPPLHRFKNFSFNNQSKMDLGIDWVTLSKNYEHAKFPENNTNFVKATERFKIFNEIIVKNPILKDYGINYPFEPNDLIEMLKLPEIQDQSKREAFETALENYSIRAKNDFSVRYLFVKRPWDSDDQFKKDMQNFKKAA